MKKLLSIVLAVILLVSVMPLGAVTVSAETATSGTTGDCTWSLDGTVLTISGTGEMGYYTYSPSAPWGTSITEVIIADGVTSIGNNAFAYCSILKDINIPDSVKSIGYRAFFNCTGIISVTIGNSLTSIGYSAFEGCSGLTSVTIPNCVTSIGNYAFEGCSGLTSVDIPDSITSIGVRVFDGCSNLTSINIPNSVISIGDRAFRGCSNLTSINIPDSVTSIGTSAFYYCNSIENVYITDIAAWCNADFLDSYSNPLYYADNLYLNNQLITNLIIPQGIIQIPHYAFSCKNIKSVKIPDSVISIGDQAFYGCTNITNITIPNHVTNIGISAFSGCSSLTNVILPNSVTRISDAFSYCSNLISVTIPDSITDIGEHAFYGCTNLKDVWYTGNEVDKANMIIGGYNTNLSVASWHYNTCEFDKHSYNSLFDESCNSCDWLREILEFTTEHLIQLKTILLNDYSNVENGTDINKDSVINICDLVALDEKIFH